MGEIYFIRHGQASFGTSDYDKLSDLGHLQSEWLGQHLAELKVVFDRVYCGTLRRHKETLTGIQENYSTGSVVFDPRLNELSYGTMEEEYCRNHAIAIPSDPQGLALLFANVMRDWKNGKLLEAPETFGAFQARIIAGLTDAVQQDQRTMIISSGGPLGITIQAALGLDIHALIELILLTHNASFSRFKVINGRLMLSQFNAIPHLEHPDRTHAQTYL